jgi:hypothetical protein
MPLYDIKCELGHVTEVFIPLDKFDSPIFCDCHAPATRVISAPMFTVDSTGYACPVTGDWIGSKHQHQENLARHNCRVLETGENEAAATRRAKDDELLDKAIDQTVEREFEALPSDKKEQLHNELVNGKLDVAVERKTA